MKVRELRNVVHRLEDAAARRRAADTQLALKELAAILEPYDDQPVAAFVKQTKQRGQLAGSPKNTRRSVRRENNPH